MYSSLQKSAFIEFDFLAYRDSVSRHVKGYFILSENNFPSLDAWYESVVLSWRELMKGRSHHAVALFIGGS